MNAPTMSAEALEVLEALERLTTGCAACGGGLGLDFDQIRTGLDTFADICSECLDSNRIYACECCDNYVDEDDLVPYDTAMRWDWTCNWCRSEYGEDGGE